MRRLVKHGIAGMGLAALTVTTAIAALSSPTTGDVAIAVPAAVASVESSATTTSTASATETALAAERTARETRDAQRARMSADTKTKAGRRAASLSSQSKGIAAQQSKLRTERAKANAKAKAKAKAAAQAKADAADKAEAKALAAAVAAAEAKKRAVKSRGYESGTTDPRQMARQILKNKFGYGDEQYDCFNYIIMRESMWKVNATNPSSGAYGIPQALPGTKMASAGSDWRTNPATQIIWGIGYMKDRYGSPCQAKVFKASHGWY